MVTDKTFSSVRGGSAVLLRLVSGSSLAATSICGGKHIRKRKGYHLSAGRKQHKISCRPSIMGQTRIRIAAASAGQSSHVLARSASHVFAFHDWRFLLPTKIMGSAGSCQGYEGARLENNGFAARPRPHLMACSTLRNDYACLAMIRQVGDQ